MQRENPSSLDTKQTFLSYKLEEELILHFLEQDYTVKKNIWA